MNEARPEEAKGDGGARSAGPDELKWFMDELAQMNTDAQAGMWTRRHNNDDTRYCRWSGQSDDGRKHAADRAEEPHPFEGASDSRIRMADGIINLKAAICTAAGTRAHLKIEGMEITDEANAAKIRTFLKWLVNNKLGRRFWREVKKTAQYMLGDTPAVGILGIWWETEWGLRSRELRPEDLAQELLNRFGDQITEETVESTTEMLMNPAALEQSAEFLADLIPGMRPERARAVLKAWHKGEPAEFPEPYERSNRPKVMALKLFEDIFVPANTRDSIQDARVIFHREWLGKSALQSRAVSHGYDEAFVAKLIGGPGEAGHEGATAFKETSRVVNGTDGTIENVTLQTGEDHKGEYEVLTAYWKAARDDGVIGLYRLAWSGLTQEAATEKELLDYEHGEYPFVEFTREVLTARLMDSRPISELAQTDQNFEKILDDVYSDHAQLTFPPIFVPERRPDSPLLIGPLSQIKRRRKEDYEWMPLPQQPLTTDKQRAEIRRRVAEYFGLPHEAVAQVIGDVLTQDMVDGFLWSMADALMMTLQLAAQYLDPAEVARVVGSEGIPWTSELREIQGQYDITLSFDSRTLDPNYVLKLAESLSRYIIPWDTSQTIMRDRLTEVILGAVNPQLAETTLRPVEEANRQEEDAEETNFAKIAAGVEPVMAESGQNFRLRLTVLETIAQRNPEAVANLGPTSLAILEKRLQHLRFQVQQEQNKQIGRVGAKPALEAGGGE